MSNKLDSKEFLLNTRSYLKRLDKCFSDKTILLINQLAEDLLRTWTDNRNVFICGNGGSAANALHIASDLHYGIGACGPDPCVPGLKVEALTANIGVLTCLANDTGYENIFSQQLEVKSREGDILIVLSGSGNSQNIVNALIKAKDRGLKSYGIFAYNGGKCLSLTDVPIHFEVNDMQIAEDAQLIVGHLCMQCLNRMKSQKNSLNDHGEHI